MFQDQLFFELSFKKTEKNRQKDRQTHRDSDKDSLVTKKHPSNNFSYENSKRHKMKFKISPKFGLDEIFITSKIAEQLTKM